MLLAHDGDLSWAYRVPAPLLSGPNGLDRNTSRFCSKAAQPPYLGFYYYIQIGLHSKVRDAGPYLLIDHLSPAQPGGATKVTQPFT